LSLITGSNGQPAIVIDGQPRLLAAMPRPAGMLPLFQSWSEAGMPVLPESQWQESDLSWLPVKIKDQGQHGSCFPAGTVVLRPNGWEIRIECVGIGDEVVTAEGNTGTVTKLWSRQHDGEIYSLKVCKYYCPQMTPEHPVLTKERGYVPVSELKIGEIVATTRHPDGEWHPVQEITRKQFSGTVYNLEVQGDNSYVAEGIGVHNCTGHGNTSALETARAIAGLQYIDLSATFPYAFNNRNQDNGAITSEVTEWMATNGTCPASMCDENTIYTRNIKNLAEAQRIAKRFRFGKRYAVQNWDEVGTALSYGFTVVISLCVGTGWESVDSEGMVPASRGYANHCIYVRSLKRRPSGARGGSQWKAEMPNSWGERWANSGIACVTKEHFENSKMGDHVAIQTALLDPEDADGPHWN